MMLTWEQFLAWVTSQGANLLTVCLKTVIVGALGAILIRIVMRNVVPADICVWQQSISRIPLRPMRMCIGRIVSGAEDG